VSKINIIIPLLGLGQRFKDQTNVPKPLIQVDEKTLIEHAIESLNIKGRYIFITRNYDNQEYNKKLTDIFNKLCTDYVEIRSDKSTSGPTETCLLALEHIDQYNPLIITNCDQLMKWNSQLFLDEIADKDPDAALVLHKSTNEKHSFAKIKNNRIIQVKEKKAISDDCLMGIHYWKYGKLFIDSGNMLVKNFKQNNILETYISETYNYLIENQIDILPFYIKNEEFICLGTPEDIDIYNKRELR
jgi:NDP-sugar pyrophosphorylase family protein